MNININNLINKIDNIYTNISIYRSIIVVNNNLELYLINIYLINNDYNTHVIRNSYDFNYKAEFYNENQFRIIIIVNILFGKLINILNKSQSTYNLIIFSNNIDKYNINSSKYYYNYYYNNKDTCII
tara:strand:- start:4759 stop:5139 length:381 start_codon:yes stop_codon:yes gene_type:complete